MNTLKCLLGVRSLLSDPEHWTQGTSARDAAGTPCSTTSAKAARFCISGAIRRVTSQARYQDGAFAAVARASGDGVISFNDDPDTTHKDVLEVLDRAIRATQRRAKKHKC